MEILLSALAEVLLGLLFDDIVQQPKIAKFREKLRGDSQEKLALHRALMATYKSFDEKYPQLTASLFDEHYLMKPEVTSELYKLLAPNRTPDRCRLVEVWQSQFPFKPKDDISIPIDYYISVLHENIKSEPNLRKFTDSRALNRLYDIASSLNSQESQNEDIIRLLEDILRQLSATSLDNSQPDNEKRSVLYKNSQLSLEMKNNGSTIFVDNVTHGDALTEPNPEISPASRPSNSIVEGTQETDTSKTDTSIIYCIGKLNAKIIKFLVYKLESLVEYEIKTQIVSSKSIDTFEETIDRYRQETNNIPTEIFIIDNVHFSNPELENYVKTALDPKYVIRANPSIREWIALDSYPHLTTHDSIQNIVDQIYVVDVIEIATKQESFEKLANLLLEQG